LKEKFVKDLMVPLPEYATISQDAILSEALQELKKRRSSSTPDGIVTMRSWFSTKIGKSSVRSVCSLFLSRWNLCTEASVIPMTSPAPD
jgi:fructose-bisphosphate aldolase class 1